MIVRIFLLIIGILIISGLIIGLMIKKYKEKIIFKVPVDTQWGSVTIEGRKNNERF